jgi:hypothetical protein
LEVEATSELQPLLEDVTSIPVTQTHYPTVNSGYLEYKFYSTASIVEISRLSFIPDQTVLYKATTLTGAIHVRSLVD